MKTLPLSRYLRTLRRERGLTQADLARALGVTRGTITHYENGARAISPAHVAALARALEADPAHLDALREGVARAPAAPVAELAPLAPLEGRLSNVTRLPSMQTLHDAVQARIGAGAYADLDAAFLRQTPWETAVGLRALADGAQLLWTSPLEAGARILVVAEDKRTYQGHLLRLAMLWEGKDERIVLFPQVPVLVPRIDKRYRIDYLAVHLAARKPAANVVVELDGGGHAYQRAHDDVRAEDLQLPLVRYDNNAVCAHDFWPRLVAVVREKAAAARVSNGEYARFQRARRRRYEGLRG